MEFPASLRMHPPLKGLRAYANWLRSNCELHLRTSRIRARPLKLTVDPTNACQLRCALCPTGLQLHDRPTGMARQSMFERLLDEAGEYVFFMDFFNWGEPLLNPHVEDLVGLAAAKKIVCRLSTNLSLPLADDRIRRLVRCGLHELIVSLDGASQETYQMYRRHGRFDLVTENMRRIASEKRRLKRATPMLTWQFLVFRFNEHEMDKARRMAGEIGVDRIAFLPPLVEVDRYPLPESDRNPAVWKPANPLYQIATPARTRAGGPCAWHYMSSAINWDGAIAPCCTLFEKQHDFGSIGEAGEHSYMEALNSAPYRAVRERFAGLRGPTGLVCERCPTPTIQRLDRHLNRQIVVFTAAAIIGKVRQVCERLSSFFAPGNQDCMGTPGTPVSQSEELRPRC